MKFIFSYQNDVGSEQFHAFFQCKVVSMILIYINGSRLGVITNRLHLPQLEPVYITYKITFREAGTAYIIYNFTSTDAETVCL